MREIKQHWRASIMNLEVLFQILQKETSYELHRKAANQGKVVADRITYKSKKINTTKGGSRDKDSNTMENNNIT